MPCDYKKYPKNWLTEIRPRILRRAKNRCEWCGVENHKLHSLTGSRVVLTIAHLEHDLSRNEDSDLKALCQKCHNAHDAPFRRQNIIRKQREKLIKAGQLELDIN